MPGQSPDLDEFPPSPGMPQPDAHGHAALLLAESMLHAMIKVRALSVSQAIDVVRAAVEIDAEAADVEAAAGAAKRSLGLLAAIETSLRTFGGAAGTDAERTGKTPRP